MSGKIPNLFDLDAPSIVSRVKIKRGKIFVFAVVGLVLWYLGSYLVLAFSGGYVFAASGQFRPINGLASVDMLVWQPRKGEFYAFRNAGGKDTYQSDWIGRVYSPLILFHRRYVAPSVRTVDPKTGESIRGITLPRRDQLHPRMLRELPAMEREFKVTWEQFARKFAEPHKTSQ